MNWTTLESRRHISLSGIPFSQDIEILWFNQIPSSPFSTFFTYKLRTIIGPQLLPMLHSLSDFPLLGTNALLVLNT